MKIVINKVNDGTPVGELGPGNAFLTEEGSCYVVMDIDSIPPSVSGPERVWVTKLAENKAKLCYIKPEVIVWPHEMEVILTKVD